VRWFFRALAKRTGSLLFGCGSALWGACLPLQFLFIVFLRSSIRLWLAPCLTGGSSALIRAIGPALCVGWHTMQYFFAGAALGAKNTARKGLKGKSFFPLARVGRAAILHNMLI